MAPKRTAVWGLWGVVTLATLWLAHVSRLFARQCKVVFEQMELKGLPVETVVALNLGREPWIIALFVAVTVAWVIRGKPRESALLWILFQGFLLTGVCMVIAWGLLSPIQQVLSS